MVRRESPGGRECEAPLSTWRRRRTRGFAGSRRETYGDDITAITATLSHATTKPRRLQSHIQKSKFDIFKESTRIAHDDGGDGVANLTDFSRTCLGVFEFDFVNIR